VDNADEIFRFAGGEVASMNRAWKCKEKRKEWSACSEFGAAENESTMILCVVC
jgi:hypothetical protein